MCWYSFSVLFVVVCFAIVSYSHSSLYVDFVGLCLLLLTVVVCVVFVIVCWFVVCSLFVCCC